MGRKGDDGKVRRGDNKMQGMGILNDDDKSAPFAMDGNNRIQNLVSVSLALCLDKIRYAVGRETVDELIKLLQREEFSLDIFK